MLTKKKKLTPLPKLLKKAQIVVNRYVRLRDMNKGCISRGCMGEVEQAGHYFNQGQHSALRFDITNIHGCCIRCNMFLSGNLIRYRQGLASRYGKDFIGDLEERADVATVKKWGRDELNEIIKKYS